MPDNGIMAHHWMKFGVFIAPFHRISENPTLAGIESTARWASARKTVMQGGRLAGLKRAGAEYYDGKNKVSA